MGREGGKRGGKSGKFRKKKVRIVDDVSRDDMDFLLRKTRYEEEEIKEWYR